MNGNDALLNNVPILGGFLQRFNLNEGDQSNVQNKSEKPIEELLIKSYSTGLLEDPNLLRTFEGIFSDLTKLGFPPKQIVHSLLIWKYTTIDQYIDALSETNGKMNHYFIESDGGLCFVCEKTVNEHKVFIRDDDILNGNETSTKSSLIKTKTKVEIEMDIKKKKESSNEENSTPNDIISNADPSTQTSCQICFDEFNNDSETYNLSCMHKFCKECVVEYVKEEINNSRVLNLKCPIRECTDLFNEGNINELMDDTYKYKYSKFKQREKVKNDSSLIVCPIVNCEGFAQKPKEEENETLLPKEQTPKKKYRLVCNYDHPFCSACNQAWHGESECQADKEIKDFATYSGFIVKKCPKCKAWTEKNAGCNHMNCKICKHDWCWLCEKDCPPNHFAIRDTPCYGRQFDHQEISPEEMEFINAFMNTHPIIQRYCFVFIITSFILRSVIVRSVNNNGNNNNNLNGNANLNNNNNNEQGLLNNANDIENNLLPPNESNQNNANNNIGNNQIERVPGQRIGICGRICLLFSITFLLAIITIIFLLTNFICTCMFLNVREEGNQQNCCVQKLRNLGRYLIFVITFFTLNPIITLSWYIYSFLYSVYSLITA